MELRAVVPASPPFRRNNLPTTPFRLTTTFYNPNCLGLLLQRLSSSQQLPISSCSAAIGDAGSGNGSLKEGRPAVVDYSPHQHILTPPGRRSYPFHEIEPRWQRYWEEHRTFRTPDEVDLSKPKFYILDMFPYPRSLLLLIPLLIFIIIIVSSLCCCFDFWLLPPLSPSIFYYYKNHFSLTGFIFIDWFVLCTVIKGNIH